MQLFSLLYDIWYSGLTMFSSFLGYGLQTHSLNSYANGSGRYLGLEDTRKLGPHDGISVFVETRACASPIPACLAWTCLSSHIMMQYKGPYPVLVSHSWASHLPEPWGTCNFRYSQFACHGHLSERQTANSPKHHFFELSFSKCYMIKEIDILVPRILPIPRFKLALEIRHRAA